MASDANGLYYMHARYYNIDIMRFINQDILTGSIDSSQSLNRYAYVEGNPVNFLDPFGLEPYFNEKIHSVLGKIQVVLQVAALASLALCPAAAPILNFIAKVLSYANIVIDIFDVFVAQTPSDIREAEERLAEDIVMLIFSELLGFYGKSSAYTLNLEGTISQEMMYYITYGIDLVISAIKEFLC